MAWKTTWVSGRFCTALPRRSELETITPERNVAPKKRTEKPKRNDKAVKMDRLLVDKANWIATRRGISAAEYLSELVRAQVERDFAKAVKETGEKQ
jgi:hypothetical protein